ncbi:6-bladed beta-propeller [Pararhodonellum marinum]|uniref:6-bladed beta-propeller n=1 Tax=Pararhodonellum marinum TaxID=2755358 RepID=UPI001E4DA372|nr:6-bladed beta-propeller [Pararhodonellum marinum]
MIKKVVFVLLIVFLLSCSERRNKIFVDLDVVSQANFSDYFEGLTYLFLEIPDSIPLVQSWKLTMTDKNIFLNDRELSNLLIFDHNGKFQRIIESGGDGPGEFIFFEDYQVKDDLIYIMEGALRKLMVFDLEGNFLAESKIDIHAFSFHESGNSKLFYFANSPEYKDYSIIRKSGQKITGLKKFNPDFGRINYSPVLGFQVDQIHQQTFIKLDTSYEVLFFDENCDLVREYEFDFGRYNFPSKVRKELAGLTEEKYKYLRENSMVENIWSFVALNSQYLMTVYQNGLKTKYVMLDEDMQPVKTIEKFTNDLDYFEGDFSPYSSMKDYAVLMKGSRQFYNEYVRSFEGRTISASMLEDQAGIHSFFQDFKAKLTDDHYVIIKAKVKE